MSTRQQGNRTENLVANYLTENYGYYCYPSRGSRGLDLICLCPDNLHLPHLGLEIGTESKSVKAAFAKMCAARRFPGMLFMVVRKIKKNGRVKLRWHVTSGAWGHDSFESALEEARKL